MAEITPETNTLWGSATNVLRKYYGLLLAIVGVPGIGDLFKDTVRSRAIDYALSKLGWFGDFLMANPVAFTSIGVVVALIVLMVMVISESSKEIPSVIYEHRDKRFTRPAAPKRWIFGFVAVMALIITAISFGIYKYWLHTSHHAETSISVNTTAKTPDVPVPIVKSKPDPIHSKKGSVQPVPQQTPPVAQQQPAQLPPTPTTQGASPQSPLERMVEMNKNLPKGDRDRLADALFDFSQVLVQANALGYKASTEGGKLSNARQDGSIVRDLDAHKKSLHDIEVSAKEFAKSFSQAREKWNYYPRQTAYVFGDNPDNLGANAILML